MSVLPVSLCKGGEVGRGVVSRASPCLDHQQPDEEQEEGWVGHVVVGRLLGVPGA